MFKTTASLASLLILLGGCSGDGRAHDGGTGSATFPLTTTSSQGSAFRLASAQFQINGPESKLLTPGDNEAVAFAELVPGAYVSRLLDTWRLQRETGGNWEDVVARLEDDAEKPFSIAAGEVTKMSYRFKVNNEAVEFGTGSLEIAVEVTESKACQLFFTEDFSDNSAGWELGPEWQIGPAKESSPVIVGYHGDPGVDHTATDDNGVAGVVIGGSTTAGVLHDWYYLTSPPIDVSSATSNVYLSFQRWLNSDYVPYMESSVEVFDGVEWDLYWHTGENQEVRDNHWTPQELDLGSGSSELRVRFGYRNLQSTAYAVSSWNLDDIKLYSTACP
jgi:hypothetical protein